MQCAAVSTRSRAIAVPVQKLPPEPTSMTSGWFSGIGNFRRAADQRQMREWRR